MESQQCATSVGNAHNIEERGTPRAKCIMRMITGVAKLLYMMDLSKVCSISYIWGANATVVIDLVNTSYLIRFQYKPGIQ